MKSKMWLGVLFGILALLIVAEFGYLGFRRRSLIDRSAVKIYTCPICGHDTEFWGYGRPLRPGILCSQCRSLERHRLMYLYLQQRTNLFSEKLSVLHFSPEPGLERVLRSKPNLRYITTNFLCPADLKLDLTDLKLPDRVASTLFSVLMSWRTLCRIERQ